MKSNIYYLRKANKKQQAVVDDMDTYIDNTERQIDDLQKQIDGRPGLTEIDCGIGTIEYTADNLQLQQLMESLAERIQQDGPGKVLTMLATKVPA